MTTTRYAVTSQVPQGSPLTALAGRTVTMPAETADELARRVAESRDAGAEPVIVYTPPSRWHYVVNGASLTSGLAAIGAALADLLDWSGIFDVAVAAFAVALVLAGLALVMEYRADHR
ncbi:hypothetical protein ACGF5C_31455 [Micromonospora sp. NPDC047620]|uniref:hypothetical protein n=1 Tax=Micromonospora sp. NPDC047620 TaxID=3364251 RepID=UPI0037222FC1